MPFVHDINPTLLQLGPLEIRFYGIVYALGFLLAYYVLNKARKKGKLELTEKDLDDYFLWLVIGIILGARIFHILFWGLGHYKDDPLQIFYIWKGGLSFHGGLAGALAVSHYFCKRKNISLGRLADLLTIPALLALAFGRIANFINGELWGMVTNVPWCFTSKTIEGCRHPWQLYASAKRFIMLGILLYINRKEHKDGFIFWCFAGLSGIGRFILDFYRDDARLLSLTMGQYLSLALMLITIIVLFKYYKGEWKK